MVISEDVTKVQEGRGQQPQLPELPTSRQWYLQASAEYSSLLISDEIERIMQYAEDADIHARNLGVLWQTDPFLQDQFVQVAANIIEQSDAVEDNVAILKNTVVRFVHAYKTRGKNRTRSHKVHKCILRRRVVRRRSAHFFPRHRKSPEQLDGGGQ